MKMTVNQPYNRRKRRQLLKTTPSNELVKDNASQQPSVYLYHQRNGHGVLVAWILVLMTSRSVNDMNPSPLFIILNFHT